MTLRLTGSSSGYTEIDAPAAAGSNTITLPSSNGSANQFLKNGSTAGTLGWSSMVETATGVGIGTSSPNSAIGFPIGTNTIIGQYRSTTHAAGNVGFIGLAIDDGGGNSGVFVYNTHNGTYSSQDIRFLTAQGGISTATERGRITSGGNFLVATTNDNPVAGNVTGIALKTGGEAMFSCSGGAAGYFNRKTNDGKVIEIWQDGAEEGNISVSGTTVAYNGAHLSRWSQIPGIDPHDKDARPEILRGTIMSNLDEMCDWIDPDSGEAQANEQLNKTKISDVEGDKNVAGVFQSWDDDDDTWVNDFYLAMTGDFVIRIAEGVTVERGDLLISAGDGTAKPQDDDLIRSSTVAKVTSTTVSHVHPDGSFCVPCVLMAC
jgi:hypothetical protein